MDNEFNYEAYIENQEKREKQSAIAFLKMQKQIKEQIEQLISESPTQPTPPENLHIHPDEKLKRIPGFLTYYANRRGEIWEWKNNNFHLVKQTFNAGFYSLVSIRLPSGRRKQFLVHRLICFTFHGPTTKGTPCCHRNDIKCDNRASNVYWGTPKTNSQDYQRNKTNPDYVADRIVEEIAKNRILRNRIRNYLKSQMWEVTEEAVQKEFKRRKNNQIERTLKKITNRVNKMQDTHPPEDRNEKRRKKYKEQATAKKNKAIEDVLNYFNTKEID